LAKTSSECGHPCLVPDLRGNAFTFPPFRIVLAVGLSSLAFILLRQEMLNFCVC
jgi:hypothetical protein